MSLSALNIHILARFKIAKKVQKSWIYALLYRSTAVRSSIHRLKDTLVYSKQAHLFENRLEEYTLHSCSSYRWNHHENSQILTSRQSNFNRNPIDVPILFLYFLSPLPFREIKVGMLFLLLFGTACIRRLVYQAGGEEKFPFSLLLLRPDGMCVCVRTLYKVDLKTFFPNVGIGTI